MNESITIEEIWAQDNSLVVIMKKSAPEICMTAIGTAEVSVTIDDKYKGYEEKFQVYGWTAGWNDGNAIFVENKGDLPEMIDGAT